MPIKTFLAASNPTSWAFFIMWEEYAHNTLYSSAMGMSPFECHFGYTPPLFSEQEVEVGVPSVLQFLRRLTWKKVRHKLLRVSQQYQRQANRRRRPAPILRGGGGGPVSILGFVVFWPLEVLMMLSISAYSTCN